jgi:hypothetical protein
VQNRTYIIQQIAISQLKKKLRACEHVKHLPSLSFSPVEISNCITHKILCVSDPLCSAIFLVWAAAMHLEDNLVHH